MCGVEVLEEEKSIQRWKSRTMTVKEEVFGFVRLGNQYFTMKFFNFGTWYNFSVFVFKNVYCLYTHTHK